jgi:ribokinase
LPVRALVVGSINMDLVVQCSRMPQRGETLSGAEFRTAAGGKGANQAVAFARLGARTTMVGRVGDDSFGRTLRDGLAADGVAVAPIGIDAAAATGIALVLLEGDGGNRIIVVGGANGRLDGSDVARAESLLDECDLTLMQLETPLPVVEAVARAARARGVLTVLDAGAATPAAAGSGLASLVDVLSPNEIEAEVLTGIAVSDVESARLAARALREAGAREVIIKMGGRGALWVGPQGELHLPAFAIRPVDTTGAGDTFTACLGVSLASGLPGEVTLTRANAAGALACLRFGAQPSLPTAAEIDEFLNARRTEMGAAFGR